MSNKYNNVLYVGVTNDLIRRIAEHKAKINKGFTYKYNVDKLIYFEQFNLMTDAIAREKQLKNWKREWKNALINKENAEWNDLSESIGVNEEYINAIKEQYVNEKDSNKQQEIAGQARNDDSQREMRQLESDFDKAIKALTAKNQNNEIPE
jgi:putative endonuclease